MTLKDFDKGQVTRRRVLAASGIGLGAAVLSPLAYILVLIAMSFTAVKSVLSINMPNNDGVFRPIKVIAPPGTITHGKLPAACAARNRLIPSSARRRASPAGPPSALPAPGSRT